VIFCRHGETDWNKQRKFQGTIDIPLNDEGRTQAQAIARELKAQDLAAVWTSPLLRAHETAVEISVAAGIALRLEERLRERDLGILQGRLYRDVKQQFPKVWAAWKSFESLPPEANSESEVGVVARVESALFDIAVAHPGKTVAVVGHGGTLRSLLKHAGSVGNASMTILMVGPGQKWRLVQQDDQDHLPKPSLKLGEMWEDVELKKTFANVTPTTILLCRHGESVWNKARKFQGTIDMPLNEAGLEQARYMAEAVKGRNVVAVWSSELARARDTAATIAAAVGVSLRIDERLLERHLGNLQGASFDETRTKNPAVWAAWKSYQPLPVETGAEPDAVVAARLESALYAIAIAHPGATVAVVLHGANGRCLLKRSIGNGSITTLEVGPGRQWRMVRASEIDHLPVSLARDALKASKM